MRAYLGLNDLKIDGRQIPYLAENARDYLELHDKIEDVDAYIEDDDAPQNWQIYSLINQILAVKQGCYLLRHTTHTCESLCDSLLELKMRLIKELKDEYSYVFDDEWNDSLVRD